MAIIGFSILPGLALALVVAADLSSVSEKVAREETRRVVESLEGRLDLLVRGSCQLLRTIAASEEARSRDWPALQRFLARLTADNEQYDVVLATDPYADVVANSYGPKYYSLADRAYVREALATGNFVVGPFTVGRSSGTSVIPLALPVLHDGRTSFLLVAAVRLSFVAEVSASVRLPEGACLELRDGEGYLLARSPSGPPALPQGAVLDRPNYDDGIRVAKLGPRRLFVLDRDLSLTAPGKVDFKIRFVAPAAGNAGRALFLKLFFVACASFALSLAMATLLYQLYVGKRLAAIGAEAAALAEQDELRPPLDGEDELDWLKRVLVDAGVELRSKERDREAAAAEAMASLREKDALLKEIHHRVKNNFQVISSLLSLQAMTLEDEAAARVFEESRSRIQSMALIHERLYRSDSFSRIDFGEYARSMAEQAGAYRRDAGGRVVLAVRSGSAPLALDAAVPLGLILNELLSNCFKHAFADGRGGRAVVELGSAGPGRGRLRVVDDGIGLPPGFDPAARDTLGLELVATLSAQLRATLAAESPPAGLTRGTCFSVDFPLPEGADWTDGESEDILLP